MSKKKQRKRKNKRLPKELIHIKNKDKQFHEKWEDDDDMLNFCHPFRCLLASGGRPNLRKTNTLKNIIIRQDPPFERILLIHCGGKNSKEYDDFNVELLDDIPDPFDEEIFDPEVKTLLILEDCNYQSMKRQELGKLQRIYAYTSTHQNLSICSTTQGFFLIPNFIRMMSNVIILWKAQDMDSMETIRRRCDFKKKHWEKLLKHLVKPWDSLWFDNTKGTKYPIRKNGYEIIDIDQYED